MKNVYEEILKVVSNKLKGEYKVELNYSSESDSFLYILNKDNTIYKLFNLDSLFNGLLTLDVTKLSNIILYIAVSK